MTITLHRRADSGRAIVEALGGLWRNDRGMCRCPAHGDRTPSLSVRLGRKRLLFHCFAGCETRAILDALHALRLVGSASWSPAERHDPPDDRSRRAAQRLWSEARVGEGSPVGALPGCPRSHADPRPSLSSPHAARSEAAHPLLARDDRVRHRCNGPYRRPSVIPVRDGRRLTRVNPGVPRWDDLAPGLFVSRRLPDASGLPKASRRHSQPVVCSTCRAGRPSAPSASPASTSHRASNRSFCSSIMMRADGAPRCWRASVSAERVVEAHYPPCSGDDWNDVLRR